MKNSLRFTKNGVVRIPKGYQWCSDCELLTPFVKGRWDKECRICGNKQSYDGCDNCGAEIHELDGPSCAVVIHENGCHFYQDEKAESWEESKSHAFTVLKSFEDSWMKQAPVYNPYKKDTQTLMKNGIERHYRRRLEEERDRLCNCPYVSVYSKIELATVHYSSHPYSSMDCMNAVTWETTTRCEICGYLNHRSDDSC